MKYKGFTKKEILNVYTNMFTSRYLDEKQLILLKQGKGFFHIGSSGHEACETAASFVFNTDIDYFYPYYRDQAFCMGIGMTVKEIILSFLAKKDDPSSGGRQMPQHFGHKNLNIISQSSPTGTQFLQAVGAGFSIVRDKTKGVVYVSSGEGTTSQGDFHEALNWASREKAPIVFHIEDNGYAISVPLSEQIAGESVYDISSGYKNLSRYMVDGTDFFESYIAFKKAVDDARKGKGPSIIVSKVVRLLPHSSSDDHNKYRTKKDLEKDLKEDPIIKFEQLLDVNNILTSKDIDKIKLSIIQEVDSCTDWALDQPDPNSKDALKNIYSFIDDEYKDPTYLSNEEIVMVDQINHALDEEMKFNNKMIIYGQDVADGKGGVFTVTRGLSTKYGKDRVFNSPLAESSIIGTAVGMSTLGYKPVVEIQFGDYIWTSMMQIRNEVTTLRYRSNNAWSCPMVIRVPVGGYIHGSLCHSQSIDGYFAHMPGLIICYPSTAEDAKGLLKAACRSENPVLFLEHKGLYRQRYAASLEPDENYLLPFGKARIVKEGNDLTVITWGAMVQKTKNACSAIDASVDIIDIRTLFPVDISTISLSINKTNRVLVVHEDNITNGFGAEIVSLINEHCFEMLDAPVRRVASKDSPIPYSSKLEDEVLVQTSWIKDAIIDIINY